MKFKHLKTFEEISSNDYRNDDPISKLKMMELIYNTMMDNDGEQLSHYKVEDKELDMESSEITFKYDGVPFRLSIEKVDEIKECAGLPRQKNVEQFKKKLGKKSGGGDKSKMKSGGKNIMGKNKISTYK